MLHARDTSAAPWRRWEASHAEARAGTSFLVAAVAAVVAIVAYHDVFSLWFTGVDALPLILSARLSSWREAPLLLVREYLSAYADTPVAGSVGIRPVGSASFALEYALWGLRPFGYHLTDAALHGLNTALVVWFVRTLRPRRPLLVATMAALAFALHPIGQATVPLMAARYDMLLCAFSLLTLIALLRWADEPSARRLAFVLSAASLALLSKETAIVLLPMAILTALWASLRGTVTPRAARRLIVLFVGVVLLYAVYRTSLLSGIGGYSIQPRDPFAAVAIMAQRLFLALLAPYPMDAPGVAWRWGTRVVAALATAVFAVCALLLARRTFIRTILHAGDDGDVATLLVWWLCVILSFYTAVYAATGIFKELYLYSGLAIWCTLFALATVAVIERLRSRHALPFAAAAVIALIAFSWLRHSALVSGPRPWRAASMSATRYIAAVERAVEQVPAGSSLFLLNLPKEVDCGVHVCFGNSYIFEDYSVDSWLALARPEARVKLVALTSLQVPLDATVPSSTWIADTSGVLIGRVSGATITLPWRSAAFARFHVEPFGDGRARVRVSPITPRGRFTAGEYLFDAFQREQLMTLRATGLVPAGGMAP
jgi:hypothetical protein